MSVVNEIPLPGIGVRYEFVTEDGDRVAIVHPRSARGVQRPAGRGRRIALSPHRRSSRTARFNSA